MVRIDKKILSLILEGGVVCELYHGFAGMRFEVALDRWCARLHWKEIQLAHTGHVRLGKLERHWVYPPTNPLQLRHLSELRRHGQHFYSEPQRKSLRTTESKQFAQPTGVLLEVLRMRAALFNIHKGCHFHTEASTVFHHDSALTAFKINDRVSTRNA